MFPPTWTVSFRLLLAHNVKPLVCRDIPPAGLQAWFRCLLVTADQV